MKNDARHIADKMRKTAAKESKELAITESSNTPANYLPPAVINSISSVKKDKNTFDKLIAKTLLDIIMNGVDNKEKMQAIDRYQKLTQSSQLFLKQGDKTVAVESNDTSVMNINLSSHVQTDEPEEQHNVISRDLVAEKNAKLFSNISSSPVNTEDVEDAEYEVIDGEL